MRATLTSFLGQYFFVHKLQYGSEELNQKVKREAFEVISEPYS